MLFHPLTHLHLCLKEGGSKEGEGEKNKGGEGAGQRETESEQAWIDFWAPENMH